MLSEENLEHKEYILCFYLYEILEMTKLWS
jgi:hypothetical protein